MDFDELTSLEKIALMDLALKIVREYNGSQNRKDGQTLKEFVKAIYKDARFVATAEQAENLDP